MRTQACAHSTIFRSAFATRRTLSAISCRVVSLRGLTRSGQLHHRQPHSRAAGPHEIADLRALLGDLLEVRKIHERIRPMDSCNPKPSTFNLQPSTCSAELET